MSILLDDREDRFLSDRLEDFGLPVSVVRLDYGDLVIAASNGWTIGYERKRITDLIASMQDRRLSGFQLKGMFSVYDRVELIVEGLWRPGANGEIEVPNGRSGGWQPLYYRNSGISYRQVDSYLYSQYECGGVAVWRSSSTLETAHLYASRYYWWQKDYELHKSHDTIFSNNPSAQKRGSVTMHQGDPNPVCILAAQIPTIDAVAWDVGKHKSFFNQITGKPSPYEMVTADEEEWRRVTWTDRKGNVKRIGKDRAKKIVDWLRGRNE